MDDLQGVFDRIVKEAHEAGNKFTKRQLAQLGERAVKRSGREIYKGLMESAPAMLENQRGIRTGFEKRNFRRWRKAFDLIETIWVSSQELGASFNGFYRPISKSENNYVFEALTHLHAKALLVASEIICLLRGGFADGALARWRTLYEVNVIATLISKEGQELALRYLSHSYVQAWKRISSDTDQCEDEYQRELRMRSELALRTYGSDLNRRNGWACALTGQRNPTFERLAEIAGMSHGKTVYHHASLHVHSNHRTANDLLGMCEADEPVLLVGPSNSGMVIPLTLTAFGLVETTSLLLLSRPNFDRAMYVNILLRMAKRMNRLANGIERRTFAAAKR